MSAKRILFSVLSVLFCILLACSSVQITQAQSAVGTQENPMVISGLPYASSNIDTTTATVGAADPLPSCATDWPRSMTYWFAFTPETDVKVRGDVYADNLFNMTFAMFQVGISGDLTEIACNNYPQNMLLTFQAQQTYYLMVGGEVWYSGSPNSIYLSLYPVYPPQNDAFANARAITSLPFSEYPNISYATVEDQEPMPSCWREYVDISTSSVWYTYTPDTKTMLMLAPSGPVAVYTGTSLGSLTEVACGIWNNSIFTAQAGTTYFIQVSMVSWTSWTGFYLDFVPPPTATICLNPSDVSIYDEVHFTNCGWDPAYIGFKPGQWDFGDGTTAEGNEVTHTFAADGAYTVTLNASTIDGRSATANVTINVATHDVGVNYFKVPETIKAGQKHHFVVSLNNASYPESVRVELYKIALDGSSTMFASLQQDVPAGKPTAFNFDFKFSTADVVGIKAFQAVANLIGNRDARPADNSIIVDMTKSVNNFKDWTVYRGNWSIVDNKLTSTSITGTSWIWAGNPPLVSGADLTAGFNLQLFEAVPGESPMVGGFMFYSSSPTMYFAGPIDGYMVEWRSLGPYDGHMYLYRWDQGSPSILAGMQPYLLSSPPKQWLVKVEGDMIRIYGDGTLIFEVQDATYRSGYTGFFSFFSTRIELSNVLIGTEFKSMWTK